MDKFRAIKFFCRVVEAKSFAAAAHLLNAPPSVVSRIISALEADLKCTLFNRTTRRLSLTEAGMAYYDRSRGLLLDLEEADSIARDGNARPSGTLRVGYHPAFRVLLLRGIGDYLAQNPGVDVELSIANSPSSLVEEGLDVVLRIGRLADSSLVARQLGWTSYVACAAPAYLDRRGRPGNPCDLRDHRAIIPGRRDEEPFTRWTFSRGKEREVVVVPVSVVARDGVGLTDAAIGQAGVAQLFDLSARHHLEAKELEAVLPDWSSEREAVHALLPNRTRVPAKARSFVEFAQSLLNKGPQRLAPTRRTAKRR
jgi:DNA-binding transcriptional LysR family regulator